MTRPRHSASAERISARGFECGIYSQMVRTYVCVRHALGMSECNAEECLGDVTRFRDPERIRNARAHALMSCPLRF